MPRPRGGGESAAENRRKNWQNRLTSKLILLDYGGLRPGILRGHYWPTIRLAGVLHVATEQRIRIRMEAYDHRVLDRSAQKIVDTAIRTGAKVSGPVLLPTHIERYTVLRGPHVDKRSREQFEIRTHKRLIDILDPTVRTVDALNNLKVPAGVEIKIKV